MTQGCLRSWVKQAEIDAGKGPGGALTTDERDELRRWRRARVHPMGVPLRWSVASQKKPRPSSPRNKIGLCAERCGEGQRPPHLDVQGAGLSGSGWYASRARTRPSPQEVRGDALLEKIRRIHADSRGVHGSPRVHAQLVREGWRGNHKRAQRPWHREGMRVPRKRAKRGPPGHSGNSCVLRKAEFKDHVWTYDFVFERTEDGPLVKILAIVDEYTRECLRTHVASSLTSEDVIDVLAKIMAERGTPTHVRSDSGPEFIPKAVRSWLQTIGTDTLFIRPGSP